MIYYDISNSGYNVGNVLSGAAEIGKSTLRADTVVTDLFKQTLAQVLCKILVIG